MHAPNQSTIALVGMRCAGKSVVGRALAQLLGRPFLDLDELLLEDARHAGEPAEQAGELLARVGELRFRGFESSALRRVLEPCQELVLATGGGSLESASNRGWLQRSARCVWLRADVETLQRRMQADPSLRPALGAGDPVLELEELLKRRSRHYRELSEWELDSSTLGPEDLAGKLAEIFG